MPIYEFKCEECGRVFEITCLYEDLQKEVDNLTCHGKTPYRLFGNAGVILKGTGWPGQAIKRKTQDEKLGQARKHAIRLKESGAVPWKEQIKQEEAEGMHSRLESDIRKREIEKAESGKLDKEMDAAVSSE